MRVYSKVLGHTRVLMILALGFIFSLGAIACGGDSSGSGSADSEEEIDLAMELPLTGVQFAQGATVGAKDGAEAVGPANLTVSGPPSIDPTLATKQVRDILAKRPDGIAIWPFPPDSWRRTLQDVAATDTLVLAVDIRPPEGSPVETFVGNNDTEIARTLARETIKAAGIDKNTSGEVLLGQCVPGNSGPLFERTKGFKEVISEELPNAKISGPFDTKVEPTQNTAAWRDILRANPDAIMALGACDQAGPSLHKIKVDTGRDIVVGALETDPLTIQGIKDGTIAAGVTINRYMEGYVPIRLLGEVARGERELPKGWVDVGFTVITQENVAEVERCELASKEVRKKCNRPKVEELFSDLDSQVKPLADASK